MSNRGLLSCVNALVLCVTAALLACRSWSLAETVGLLASIAAQATLALTLWASKEGPAVGTACDIIFVSVITWGAIGGGPAFTALCALLAALALVLRICLGGCLFYATNSTDHALRPRNSWHSDLGLLVVLSLSLFRLSTDANASRRGLATLLVIAAATSVYVLQDT